MNALRARAGESEIDFKPKPIVRRADILLQAENDTTVANSCRTITGNARYNSSRPVEILI